MARSYPRCIWLRKQLRQTNQIYSREAAVRRTALSIAGTAVQKRKARRCPGWRRDQHRCNHGDRHNCNQTNSLQKIPAIPQLSFDLGSMALFEQPRLIQLDERKLDYRLGVWLQLIFKFVGNVPYRGFTIALLPDHHRGLVQAVGLLRLVVVNNELAIEFAR